MIYRLHPDYRNCFLIRKGPIPKALVAVGGDLSVRRLLAAYGARDFPVVRGRPAFALVVPRSPVRPVS